MSRRRSLKRRDPLLFGAKRMNDRHDRWMLLAFEREVLEVLARPDGGVDQKIFLVAALARRLAPSIATRRAALKLGPVLP